MSRFHLPSPPPSQNLNSCDLTYSANSKELSITDDSGSSNPALIARLSRTLSTIMGSYAPVIRRLVSFLFVGGLGAALNLLCFSILYNILLRLSIGVVVYLVAFAIATELSLFHNFLLNDWITFRHLRGRHWMMRCLRFHVTSTGGALLTLGISFSLFNFFGMSALVAQGTALVAATLFNFFFHHVFTYA